MYYVYILTNWNNSTLYIGVTSDIARRVSAHKSGAVEGFTKKYNLHKLIYCETTENVHSALTREKQLKGWTRKRKNDLITQANPTWEEIEVGLQ